MLAVPTPTPNVSPENSKTTAVLLLLHVPSGVGSLSSTAERKHTPDGPDIGDGDGLTVTFVDMAQPPTVV